MSKKILTIEYLIFAAIILLGAFLRFYHLPEWFHFASDEARDLFIIKDIFQKGDIPFRGPTLSITGDKFGFLGPAYYYLIIIPYLIGNGSPISPVVFTVLLSIATIYLFYRIGKDFINVQAGLIAALIYSISYLAITFSRAAWNPNLLPFFITLGIYSFLQIYNGRERYMIWLAISTAIAIQLHSTAFLWPVAILIAWAIIRPKAQNKRFYFYGAGTFLLILIPWLAAEIRSGFANTNAYFSIIGSKTETFAGETYIPPSLWLTFFNFFDELLTNRMVPGVTAIIIAGTIIFFIVQIYKNRSGRPTCLPNVKGRTQGFAPTILFLFIWLLVSFVGYYFYKHILFIHYFIFLFPLAILLASIFLGWLWRGIWKTVVIAIVAIIVAVNLYSFYDYASAMQNRRLDKFTHATDIPFEDIDAIVKYINEDAEAEFRLHFILPSGPPFQNSRAYEYMFSYYENRKIVETDAKIIYAIIQPKDTAFQGGIEEMGDIINVKEFGAVRIIKMTND